MNHYQPTKVVFKSRRRRASAISDISLTAFPTGTGALCAQDMQTGGPLMYRRESMTHDATSGLFPRTAFDAARPMTIDSHSYREGKEEEGNRESHEEEADAA